MDKLRELGTEQTKRTLLRHGAREPLFGVKVGDLKKLVKDVKKDQVLAQALYTTGNSDAMYLAGLTVNPKLVSKELLQDWVRGAYWHMLAEYTVGGVVAESPWALELAREWVESSEEMIAAAGWSVYANYAMLTDDQQLDLAEYERLLRRVGSGIHQERNRVRYVMNGFVIAVGSAVAELHETACDVARSIGKVDVYMGDTACKVPLAADYIGSVVASGKLGVKKKTCIC